ncbi:hypothetical protein D3C71_1627270 [compost metagenome]
MTPARPFASCSRAKPMLSSARAVSVSSELMASMTLPAWIVVMTRWPEIAARSAWLASWARRISPSRMYFGVYRIARSSASPKVSSSPSFSWKQWPNLPLGPFSIISGGSSMVTAMLPKECR